MKIKRTISSILVGIMAFLMVSGLDIDTVKAAGESVVVNTSTTDVIVGQDINVSVTLNCPIGLYAAMFELKYDASMFTYVSGDAGGSSYSGSIPINYMESGVPTTITWNFTFKAAKTGTSGFSIVGDTFIDKNIEGFEPAYQNASVKVWAQGSDDATLSSLQIAGATISPAFAKWTMQYTAYVGTDVTSVDVVATSSQGGRTEIAGNTTNLVYGNNVITVTSYAPNGKAMTYSITVVRPEPPTEPPTTEPPTEPPKWTEVRIDNAVYHISPDYSKEMIPEGFEANIIEYGENEVLAATNNKLKLQLFYLLDEESNGNFYIYDSKEKTFYPFVFIDFLENRYIVIDAGKADAIPGDTKEGTIMVGEKEIKAYINSEESSFAYFYAVNQNGTYSWYCYDTVEKTIQRVAHTEMNAVEEETTTVEEIVTTEPESTFDYSSENESLRDVNEGLLRIRNIAIVAAGVLLVVLIGLIVVLIANKAEKKHSISDENINYSKIEDEMEKPEEEEIADVEAEIALSVEEMSATSDEEPQKILDEEPQKILDEEPQEISDEELVVEALDESADDAQGEPVVESLDEPVAEEAVEEAVDTVEEIPLEEDEEFL